MLRSIKKAFDMVKQEDPDTAITVHTIRMWCKEGKIKCLTAGNKILRILPVSTMTSCTAGRCITLRRTI